MPKIGLEVHIAIDSTESKLFCSCPNRVSPEPNSLCCPVCLGMPGSKPRVNEKAVKEALKAVIALGCKPSRNVIFSRKTYHYPDMSKNFQITQYDFPLSKGGSLKFDGREIQIKRVNLEEDPARLKHPGGIEAASYTLVDYNRSGVPLLEVVTQPQIKSPKEARKFLEKLAEILGFIKIYNPSREGALRVDSNVSIKGGKRTEIKNLGSFKDVEKAIRYEISRQRNCLRRGKVLKLETRGWNSDANVTLLLRIKEEKEEYGYIAEPDLASFEITDSLIDEAKGELPELPAKKRERYIKEFRLSEKLAEALVSQLSIARIFEKMVKKVKPKLAASFIAGPLLKTLNWHGLRWPETGLKDEWLAKLLKGLESGRWTDRISEEILRKMIEDRESPPKLVKKYGLKKIEARERISSIVKSVLEANEKAVADYRAGRKKAIHYLIGRVVKKSKGAIDAKKAREFIKELIG